MIRVLARHVDDAEGHLIGDFPPSEITSLLDLLNKERVFFSGEADDLDFLDAEDGSPLQWILTDETRPRLVLEVIFDG